MKHLYRLSPEDQEKVDQYVREELPKQVEKIFGPGGVPDARVNGSYSIGGVVRPSTTVLFQGPVSPEYIVPLNHPLLKTNPEGSYATTTRNLRGES